ncbi:probable vacuolar protein sorting-associated protein 13A at C-terminar half [Coccomyxa sp. Obi]|nr:probable vacuolar protein sorting-associated protein 13A at C-terminar half [Coccomyxa sp. Obi]
MSVPPYRIENQCSDVHIYLVQACLAGERPGRWIWLPPRVAGSSLAYAWDEPSEEHRLRVKARVAGKTGTPVLAEYSLDRLGPKPVLRLPTAKRGSADNMANTNVPSDLQEKVASLLASESSRKVYITVFADGPTRVLRFADVQNVGAEEAQQSILDLAARLKQVEEELWQVNARFSALHGATGDRQLDLYGRAPSAAAGQQPASAAAAADETGMPAPTGGTSSPPVRLKMAGTGTATPAGPSASGVLQLVPEDAPLGRHESVDQEQVYFQTPEAQRLLDTGPSTVAEAGSCASSESGKSVTEEIPPPSRMAILEASALESRARRGGGGGDLGHLLPMSASSRNVQGSQLMRSAAEGDSALLLGGDLIVTVFMAEQLHGQEKLTHPFARVRVEDQSQLTTVQWQSLNPVWEETLFFRDVCAASELVVEVWDVGGQKSSEQLQRITIDPVKLIANSRFQGRVEVPLSETLRLRRGSKHWYTLMRRDAADTVSGQLQLGFAWDVTARSLLSLKLAALENVLAQRQEILCALNPVPASVTQRWTREALKAPEDNNQGSLRKVKSAEKLLDDVLSWHSLDEQRSTLVVTVLEARGMQPRKGVVVAFQAHQLPNPLVELTVPGHVAYQAAAKQTLKPHFQTAEPARFQRLASDAMLTVRLYDDKAGRKKQLLGEAQLSCSHLQGVDPMYVWLPLTAAKTSLPWHSRHSGVHFIESVAGVPELQVHLRLQWVRQVERGRIMHLDLNMEGLGFSVVGGLQDELFNMTLDQLRIKAERTRAEAKLNGSIQRIQLDNQMLDATQPVVLAPASAAHAHAEAGKSGGPTPIMRFGVVRSFANSLVSSAVESGSAPSSPVAGPSVLRKEGDILSFRSVYLDVGEIDVQTDDGFLEAFLTFIVALPLADVWQDVAWREQQRRLLTAQFGPREVESLAMNAVLPLDTEDGFTGTPLRWVQERELKELAVLRGQSAHSSWFFIESAHIGDINANVTIALTSSILAARHGATAPEPASGLFRRLIGASGFQLINVNNVPLSLRGWSVDTRLIGRKALTNSLMRHYIAQAISEAHKVLGGAGPAIAAVPLTVVWAGGSFVTLATGLGAGKVGPVGAVQRVGYVFFMSIAQVVGSFSRVGLSLFTYMPPNQTGTFSDTGALNRAVQRPANAFDAFRRAVEEGCSGLWSGVSGVVMDPTQGFHSGGLPVALLGVGKGLVGLAVRPTMGLLEMTSKGTYGMGLVCLGREAISGSTLRRVRAPGALAEDSSEAVENAKDPEVRARNQRLIESWQSALPTLFPAIKAGKVLDVMQAGEKRVVLVTDKDVALLRLKIVSLRSTYRPMWFVRLSCIQTVRGDSERLRIVIDYLHQVDTHCMGKWTVPGRKRIPCSSRDVLERLALKINYNIRTVSQGARPLPDTGFARFSARELSIFR